MKPTALNKKNLSYPKPSSQQQTKMQCAPSPEWFGSVSDGQSGKPDQCSLEAGESFLYSRLHSENVGFEVTVAL